MPDVDLRPKRSIQEDRGFAKLSERVSDVYDVRPPRTDSGGGASYRWGRTRSGGIPASVYDPTGGSQSLGDMTPGSALCDLLISVGATYEIQAGEEATIFNGVQSVIGADTIIGIIKHQDGKLFVIVEDCLSGQQPILTEGETAGPVSSFPEIDQTLVGSVDDMLITDDDASP